MKMGIAIAHVEAGLRSFDRTMPEELNRIVTDHLSEYLFITEPSAQKNLLKEGLPEEKIFFVGNVMVDTLLKHKERAQKLNVSQKLGLAPRAYALLTLHRPSNVDDPETLANILDTMWEISRRLPIVFPCHPRTRAQLPTLAERLPWLKRNDIANEKRVINRFLGERPEVFDFIPERAEQLFHFFLVTKTSVICAERNFHTTPLVRSRVRALSRGR